MADPEVASVEIVEVPRLSIARLLDLRVLLDSVLACGPGKEILGGEADGQVLVERTARPIRRATAGHETRRYISPVHRGKAADARSHERVAGPAEPIKYIALSHLLINELFSCGTVD